MVVKLPGGMVASLISCSAAMSWVSNLERAEEREEGRREGGVGRRLAL